MDINSNIAKRLGAKDFAKENDYKFSKIKKLKIEYIKKNPDKEVIDMGVGEPDEMADVAISNILYEEACKKENRFYSDNGIQVFNESAIDYIKKVYNVGGLNPEKNVMHGIGSKSILAMLPGVFINPGDITLQTTPGYPILGNWTKYFGGDVYNMELTEKNDFYPEFDKIPSEILKKAKLMYLNYPNNPTGQIANKIFYEKAVKFAKRHNIIIISDMAYGALVYDAKPLSIFSIDGSMDVCIEVHSMSKAFNMTGWRIAFILGHERYIKAYGKIKNNTDSGQFRAIQKSAVYAMSRLDITERMKQKYIRRFDLLVKALNNSGFQVEIPKGTFYLYVKAPIGTKSGKQFYTAEECANYILEKAGVVTVPWDDAGKFLRLSATFEANEENELGIINKLENRFRKLGFIHT